jgi:hypothetical protein
MRGRPPLEEMAVDADYWICRTAVPVMIGPMKRLLVPVALGMSAARHIAWYVSYQLNGEARTRG